MTFPEFPSGELSLWYLCTALSGYSLRNTQLFFDLFSHAFFLFPKCTKFHFLQLSLPSVCVLPSLYTINAHIHTDKHCKKCSSLWSCSQLHHDFSILCVSLLLCFTPLTTTVGYVFVCTFVINICFICICTTFTFKKTHTRPQDKGILFLGKVIGQMVSGQLQMYVEENCLGPFQLGLRPRRDSEMALVAVHDNLLRVADGGWSSLLVLSVALDIFDRSTLLDRLSEDLALSWLWSFLDSHVQRVQLGDELSLDFQLWGAQGCSISPMSFNIYVKPVRNCPLVSS